jgi:SSS family solute:Na+ symporter
VSVRVLFLLVGAVAYFALMVTLGRISQRTTEGTKQSYFLADRRLSGLVLFAAVFGTNMTAFVMLGLPGVTYHAGVGMWAMLIGPVVLILPINIYFGYRCWLVAREYDYTTPVEFYRERYQSELVGLLAFVFFVLWTIPYVITGIIGGGRAFDTFTRGAIPFWLGALLVTLVVGYYTTAGGMKGTAWTNTAQVVFFLVFLFVALVGVPIAAGGLEALTDQVTREVPGALTRRWNGPTGWGPTISNFLLFGSILFAFPFIWIRLVSARSGRDLRKMATFYPVAILLTWGPAVLLGLWGAALLPGLEGTESDAIIFALAGQLLPAWVASLGLIGLLAMVMSSMDAQILTLSNMFTLDIVTHYRPRMAQRTATFGRLFVVGLLAFMYAVSFIPLPRLFDIATFAFTGFSGLVPFMLGGIFWRRANKHGAIASIIVGQVVAVAGFFELYPPAFGLQPVVWVLTLSTITFVVVTLLTPPQIEAAEKFHSVWDRVWAASPPAAWRRKPAAGAAEPAVID